MEKGKPEGFPDGRRANSGCVFRQLSSVADSNPICVSEIFRAYMCQNIIIIIVFFKRKILLVFFRGLVKILLLFPSKVKK